MNKKTLNILLISIISICLLIGVFLFFNRNDNSNKNNENNNINNIQSDYVEYHFRNEKLLIQHFNKHGIEMGFESKEAYEKAASDIANNKDALHKKEKEDNDDVYYLEKTNDFVVVSYDGFIRTYFKPDSGIKYYNKQ